MDIKKITNKIAARFGLSRKRKSSLLKRQAPSRVKMEMDCLVKAALEALDQENSDRNGLLEIYGNAWKDSQVISEHEKAEAFLITEPFEVCKKGSDAVDKERTLLLDRPWFTRFLTFVMDSEFWGYQLIEFGEQDPGRESLSTRACPAFRENNHDKPLGS